MKCLGLLGGLSPEATAVYQRLLHGEVRRLCGPTHSAFLRICALDYHDLTALWQDGDWAHLASELEPLARGLIEEGAEALLFDSSTLHVVADQVRKAIRVPFFGIVNETAQELEMNGIGVVALFGTRCRAEERVWIDGLLEGAGIHTVLPSIDDRKLILAMMDRELIHGYAEEISRVDVIRIMKTLKRQGVGAFVMASAEMSVLIDPYDARFPIVDAPQLHTRAAVRWALGRSRSNLPGANCALAHESPS